MGATKLSFGPGDFEKFSERELVQHFYETRNTECITELWRRHEKTVRNAVRRRVFAGNVCPTGQSRDSFAEAALSLAQFNFCRRINGFLNFRGPFELWASCIAGSAVLDELKARVVGVHVKRHGDALHGVQRVG